MDKKVTPEQPVRRKRKLTPLYFDARRAMKKFMSLPSVTQNTENKRACVDMVLGSSKYYGDRARFWADLENESNRLERAKDLIEFCEQHRLNFKAVKQHLILEGKAVVNDIILNGCEKYEAKLRMFGHLLYDVEKEIPSTRMEEEEIKAKTATANKMDGHDE